VASWTISTLPDGRCEVAARGRGSQTVEDEDAAVRHIRSRMKKGDRVHRVEEDGYLVSMTRHINRAKP
jgi:hypothetical protein